MLHHHHETEFDGGVDVLDGPPALVVPLQDFLLQTVGVVVEIPSNVFLPYYIPKTIVTISSLSFCTGTFECAAKNAKHFSSAADKHLFKWNEKLKK